MRATPDLRAQPHHASIAALGLLLLCRPAAVCAQGGAPGGEAAPAQSEEAKNASGGEWFPNKSVFWPLLAAPRENGLYASLISFEMDEGPLIDGRIVAADVQLGYLLEIRRFQTATERRPALDLGLQFTITPRFNLSQPQRDLINTDFRIGIPFGLAYGRLQARVGYLHESSHLGDEIILRSGIELLEQSTRDALELTVALLAGEMVRVYAGGAWNWNHSIANEDLQAWAGIEVDPGRTDPARHVWPYLAVDLLIRGEPEVALGSSTGVGATGVAGVAFRVVERQIRLELRGHLGPSPMGQFRTFDENYFGIAVRFEPFPPP